MSKVDYETKELCRYLWKTYTREDILRELNYFGYKANKGLCLDFLFGMLVTIITQYRRDPKANPNNARLRHVDDTVILKMLAERLYDSFGNS